MKRALAVLAILAASLVSAQTIVQKSTGSNSPNIAVIGDGNVVSGVPTFPKPEVVMTGSSKWGPLYLSVTQARNLPLCEEEPWPVDYAPDGSARPSGCLPRSGGAEDPPKLHRIAKLNDAVASTCGLPGRNGQWESPHWWWATTVQSAVTCPHCLNGTRHPRAPLTMAQLDAAKTPAEKDRVLCAALKEGGRVTREVVRWLESQPKGRADQGCPTKSPLNGSLTMLWGYWINDLDIYGYDATMMMR